SGSAAKEAEDRTSRKRAETVQKPWTTRWHRSRHISRDYRVKGKICPDPSKNRDSPVKCISIGASSRRATGVSIGGRSEERRVGKECRGRRSRYDQVKTKRCSKSGGNMCRRPSDV